MVVAEAKRRGQALKGIHQAQAYMGKSYPGDPYQEI